VIKFKELKEVIFLLSKIFIQLAQRKGSTSLIMYLEFLHPIL
jgi:hypothetical protein